MAKGFCFRCKEKLDANEDSTRDFRNGVCSQCTSQYRKERDLKNRSAILKLFGGKCCQCGFSDHRALQLDHIHGAIESRGEYMRSGNRLYDAILAGRKNIKDFQLLCANCNTIKKYINREMPRTKVLRMNDEMVAIPVC